ncbi:MAG: aminotransferase class III-fold pyridoxal phosphate-dependent enzyme, partial [Acidobacteriota bacterium]
RKYGTLLILDEVQTGLGRTGTMFAYQSEGFVPDVLVLAKALSGGIAPISVTITTPEIYRRAYGSVDRFDLHSSTFAGNAFSSMVAHETLKIVTEEKLITNSQMRGEQLITGLQERLKGHPLVRNIRGRGLLAGIELGPTETGWMNRLAPALVSTISKNIFGQWAALKLLERGIVCQPASQQWNTLRIEPPLTIQESEIDESINTIAEVLGEYQGVAAIIKDVTERLGEQFLKGWTFE